MRVVDGDTVDVDRAGEQVRIRLLNIDTPETKHPNKAVQCMGPEATQKLEELLAQGDRVVLQYDEERTDRYGRTLAGVFEDGVLVNAEIARAGLGVPVVFEPNRRFHPQVEAAWREAETRQVGLKQPGLDCTLSALASPEALGAVPPAEPTPPTDLDALGEEIAAARATQLAVRTLRGAVEAATSGGQPWMETLYADELPGARESLARHQGADARLDRLRREAARLEAGDAPAPRAATPPASSTPDEGDGSGARAQAEDQAAQEREAAEERAAQASAAAQEEAQREAAEERAAQERAAAQEQARRDAAEAEARTRTEQRRDSGSSSSGGTAQKAPNRCYAPGGQSFTYCDDDSSTGSSSGGSSSGGSSTGGSGGGGPVSGSDGVCPDGYPVKVSGSGKYHLPGGASYDDTGAKRCYASAAAAAADGAVAAKG